MRYSSKACLYCEHLDKDAKGTLFGLKCKKTGNQVFNEYKIQDWCPLVEVEEEDES